jgi:Mg-chelatase subunit ChlI
VDGHRADLVILKTARAHAAFDGRSIITEHDILLAAELALPHRLKRGPLEETPVSLHDLEERLEQARSGDESSGMADEQMADEGLEVKKNMTY